MFGLLIYFNNTINSVQSHTNLIQPTNNVSHLINQDIHNAYNGFLPYVQSLWLYAFGIGIVVALIFVIATSIREEG